MASLQACLGQRETQNKLVKNSGASGSDLQDQGQVRDILLSKRLLGSDGSVGQYSPPEQCWRKTHSCD